MSLRRAGKAALIRGSIHAEQFHHKGSFFASLKFQILNLESCDRGLAMPAVRRVLMEETG
jgi:hypothetical protein